MGSVVLTGDERTALCLKPQIHCNRLSVTDTADRGQSKGDSERQTGWGESEIKEKVQREKDDREEKQWGRNSGL